MAPALQVTHLLAFTLTPIAPSLRIVRLPAGPTLSFRIERYSLAKDVLHASKRARSIGLEYLTPPLVRFYFPSTTPNKSNPTPPFYEARPRLVPTTITRRPAPPRTHHEIIPIPLPAPLPQDDLPFLRSARRARIV